MMLGTVIIPVEIIKLEPYLISHTKILIPGGLSEMQYLKQILWEGNITEYLFFFLTSLLEYNCFTMVC